MCCLLYRNCEDFYNSFIFDINRLKFYHIYSHLPTLFPPNFLCFLSKSLEFNYCCLYACECRTLLQRKLFLSQWPPVANSSSAWGGASWAPPLSKLAFQLIWCYAGLRHQGCWGLVWAAVLRIQKGCFAADVYNLWPLLKNDLKIKAKEENRACEGF